MGDALETVSIPLRHPSAAPNKHSHYVLVWLQAARKQEEEAEIQRAKDKRLHAAVEGIKKRLSKWLFKNT